MTTAYISRHANTVPLLVMLVLVTFAAIFVASLHVGASSAGDRAVASEGASVRQAQLGAVSPARAAR